VTFDPGPLGPFLDGGACVLDGGLATELERRGADLRDPLWSARVLLEAPSLVADVHLGYFEAGADVAITASYQASEQGFAARGIDRSGTADILATSVALARAAADQWTTTDAARARGRPSPLVAASVGPYGAVLADGSEYRGDYGVSIGFLTDFHAARLEPLIAAGPDLLAIETIPSGIEVRAILDALARLGDPVPAWCSLTLRDGATLADGAPLIEALEIATSSPSVVAVGVNCSPPASSLDAVGMLTDLGRVPVVAYPNRGARWDAAARSWAGGDDVDMGEVAAGLGAAGAVIVGGCCGTGPDDVRSIARALGVPG
jgi:homocysteine S-methyltransferase